jgi:Family of unknown function (DUF5996)
MPLVARTVADSYQEFSSHLRLAARLNTHPVEVDNGIPFEQDDVLRDYDPKYVNRWWHALLAANPVVASGRARGRHTRTR